MSFKPLVLSVITDSNNYDISARICRSDNKMYDVKTKKFQSDSYFNSTPDAQPLIPLTPGTGLNQWIVQTSLDINPSEFTDGDYSVYYHDNSELSPDNIPKLFDGTQISIFNGEVVSQKIPSTTDIAIRILESRVGNNNVRNTLLGSQERFAKIDNIYNNIIDKT